MLEPLESQLLDHGIEILTEYRCTRRRKTDSPVTDFDVRRTDLFDVLMNEGLSLTSNQIRAFLDQLPEHAPRYLKYHYYKGMAYGIDLEEPALNFVVVDKILSNAPSDTRNQNLYHFYRGLSDGLLMRQFNSPEIPNAAAIA